MAVSSNVNEWTMTGNGVTAAIAYDNVIFASTDLKVYLDGVLQASGYTVSGVGVAAGGNVTFDTAPASGVKVVVEREVPYTNDFALQGSGDLPSPTIVRMIDRMTVFAQQLLAKLNRAPTQPVTSTKTYSLSLPDLEAGYLWRLNSAGTALEAVDSSTLGATGPTGAAGSDGVFAGTEATVAPAAGDKVALLDVSDSDNPKYATAQAIADLASTADTVARNGVIDNAWNIAVLNGTSVFAMANTIADTFEDTAGVSAGDSTNEIRNVTDENFGNHYNSAGTTFSDTDVLTAPAADLLTPDGKEGTVVFAVSFNGDGSDENIIDLGHTYWDVGRTSGNKIRIRGYNAAASQILLMESASSYTISSGVIHVAISWDLATGTGQMYIDGSDDRAGSPTLTNDTIDYAKGNNARVGAGATASADMDLYFIWLSPNHIDLSANIGTFFASGNPQFLGDDGKTADSGCVLFMEGGKDDFTTNKADNTTFSLTGTVETAARHKGTAQTLTLESASFTADSAPSELRVVAEIEDIDGTLAIGTDVNLLASRDGGTTVTAATGTEATVVDKGSSIKIIEGTVDVSGDPSGTACRWQLTCNAERILVRSVAIQADVGLSV